ncbi:MAG TPA: urate hydroxylase PuuD [Myxococcales bacterium]|jgi:uncharacterized membrane protein
MDTNANEWLNLIFRWIHVLAGVMWIGHLWFFNFVNGQVAKTYDADSKKKVVPELMPRALYWFRWGAAYTFITGILLLWVVYWAGNAMGTDRMSSYASGGIGLVIIIVCFAIYDVLWKSMKNEMAGMIVSLVLFAVYEFILQKVLGFGGRATFIYAGGLFGTIMAANVWMRIWPNQRKIIAGVKGTSPAPEASIPVVATLRSKHNTYMSVPLIFFMVSNHFPTVYGSDYAWVIAIIFVLVGWGITKFLYGKAGSPAPSQY